LIEELQATRWTGRPGYPIRMMIGLALAKSLYALPTWTKVVELVGEHWMLQRVLGCEGDPPSKWARLPLRQKAAGERCGGRALHRRRDRRLAVPSYDAGVSHADPQLLDPSLGQGCRRQRL
jgi:hypothetical protein